MRELKGIVRQKTVEGDGEDSVDDHELEKDLKRVKTH